MIIRAGMWVVVGGRVGIIRQIGPVKFTPTGNLQRDAMWNMWNREIPRGSADVDFVGADGSTTVQSAILAFPEFRQAKISEIPAHRRTTLTDDDLRALGYK